MYEWTSLTRDKYLLVLQNLQDKLSTLFPQPHASQISALWKVRTQNCILHVFIIIHVHVYILCMQDFLVLYKLISSNSPSANEIHTKVYMLNIMANVPIADLHFTAMLVMFKGINNFLGLGRDLHLEGFQKKYVTPYMHCMVYHIPEQIRQHGSILKFSGQSMHICDRPCEKLP